MEITKQAADELKKQIGDKTLNIAISSQGCSCSSMSMSLTEQKPVKKINSIPVHWAEEAEKELEGTTLDFIEHEGKKGFVFKKNKCCGSGCSC